MTKTAKTTRQTSVGRMLNVLARRLNVEMNARLDPLGLSIAEFSILMTLLEHEDQTQTQLGEKTALPPYSTTRSIDTLVSLNLAERRADPNSRRAHRIFLTPQGHAIGPQIFTIVAAVNDWVLNGLGNSEKQAFTATLAKLL